MLIHNLAAKDVIQPPQHTEDRFLELAVGCRGGELGNARRERWIHLDEVDDFAREPRSAAYRERKLADHLRGARRQYVCAYDSEPGVRNDDRLAFCRTVSAGAIRVVEAPFENPHPPFSQPLARLCRGHADMRKFGVRKSCPGDEGGGALRARIEHVAERNHGFGRGAVRKEEAASAVSGGIDPLDAAAYQLVDA